MLTNEQYNALNWKDIPANKAKKILDNATIISAEKVTDGAKVCGLNLMVQDKSKNKTFIFYLGTEPYESEFFISCAEVK